MTLRTTIKYLNFQVSARNRQFMYALLSRQLVRYKEYSSAPIYRSWLAINGDYRAVDRTRVRWDTERNFWFESDVDTKRLKVYK